MVILKVCMIVRNDMTKDGRVEKEAQTLAEMGHEVVVLCLLRRGTEPLEPRDDYLIKRVPASNSYFADKLLDFLKGVGVVFYTILSVPLYPILKARELLIAIRGWISRRIEALQSQSGQRALPRRNRIRNFARAMKTKLPILHSFLVWMARPVIITKRRMRRFFKRLARQISRAKSAARKRNNLRSGLRVYLGERFGSFFEKAYPWIKSHTLFLNDPHYCPNTIRAAIAERADVYHAHDLNTLLMAWKAAKVNNAKLVYDAHELYLDRNPVYGDYNALYNMRLRFREKRLIRRAFAVITVGESIASLLSRRYGIHKPEVIRNIPPMPDKLDPSLLRKRLCDELNVSMGAETKIMLYLGSIAKDRGLEQGLLALHNLPGVVFVIMGYGHKAPFLSELIALADREGLRGRMHLLTPVDSSEVALYASGADVGLVPIQNVCLSYYYCSPNKIFECIAANVPVAASNFPELKRIVEKYDVGVLFNEQDPKAIAQAVKKILEDPHRHQQMKANTKLAAKDLNWEHEAAKLKNIYEKLRGPSKNNSAPLHIVDRNTPKPATTEYQRN